MTRVTFIVRPRTLSVLGTGCLLGLGLTYLLAVRTARGQRLDDVVFRVVFSIVPNGWPVEVFTLLARPILIVVLGLVALALALAAVGRQDWGALAAAVATVLLSLTATLVLRDRLLYRPELVPDPFPASSLPSMHVSATAALGVAVVMLWPYRPPVWLMNLVIFAVVIAVVGNVVSHAHRPSDVVASVFLVLGVGALVAALTARTRAVSASAAWH